MSCRESRISNSALLSAVAVSVMFAGTLLTKAQVLEHGSDSERDSIRFGAIDIFIDSADAPLAAYQLELIAKRGNVKIVGVEGGEHAAFVNPPYYDPKALHNEDRIILAAFNTGQDLPTGQTRVARVHVQIRGIETPGYEIKLVVAASSTGEAIDANASCSERD